MLTSNDRQIKRRADVFITFFATLVAVLLTILFSAREGNAPVPASSGASHTAGAWASIGAITVAAFSFSVAVFSVFYACFRLRSRHQQAEIKPLLTPVEALIAVLILLWCLSVFGLLEWFGVSADTEQILARLTLPLIAMGLFSTTTPATTSVGKRIHATFFGITLVHFLIQTILAFAAPTSTRAAAILGGIVYALLSVGILVTLLCFTKYVIAETPRHNLAVFAGISLALSLAMPFAPLSVLRHFLCAYFGAILLCGTAYKTRIIGHESVMLRHAQDYRYRAYHDSLTGCRNRTAYAHDIEKLENATPAPRSVGILYFDVNGLKRCNDDEGHDAGDRLIVSVANALCNLCGRTHIYRVGGDEFIGLFTDVGETELAHIIVALHGTDKCNNALSRIAVGFAWSNECPVRHLSDLQRAAEKEMYIDKRRFTPKESTAAGDDACP